MLKQPRSRILLHHDNVSAHNANKARSFLSSENISWPISHVVHTQLRAILWGQEMQWLLSTNTNGLRVFENGLSEWTSVQNITENFMKSNNILLYKSFFFWLTRYFQFHLVGQYLLSKRRPMSALCYVSSNNVWEIFQAKLLPMRWWNYVTLK